MTIVEELADSKGKGRESYRRDTITLTWEERRQGHGRRKSDTGIPFAISLPLGTVLKGGDLLILDAERTIVEVAEALEPVYVVEPASPQEWAFYAYHVGNRHQPAMIGERELIFMRSPAVRSLLDQLQAPYTEDDRAFTGALAGAGHL